MKCIRCGNDAKYSERPNRVCPKCSVRFAFEPKSGDLFTDAAFQKAVERISSKGALRYDADGLYYELCRARKPKRIPLGCLAVPAVVFAIGLLVPKAEHGVPFFVVGSLALAFFLWQRLLPRKTVPFDKDRFSLILSQWRDAHGEPPGMIVPKPRGEARAPRRIAEDVADYSFDRAVVCDKASTVDLLVANSFHFENNCAVLSVDGHPEPIFETVRAMLKRNPRLHVFALHDATLEGCQLAFRLSHDPAWFAGHVPVVDVGLRPAHAGPFAGLLLPSRAPAEPGRGVSPEEAAWLSRHALEAAAIRPEQLMKRLFRAVNRKLEDGTGGDGGSSSGDGGGPVTTGVEYDSSSFASDAPASEGGGDGFG